MLALAGAFAQSADLKGVKVALERYSGPATVSAESLERFKVRVHVDQRTDTQPIDVRVELPVTGRDAWPVADVEVRDVSGTALLVQRSGIEWEKLLIPLTGSVHTFVVQAIEPPNGWPITTGERDRIIQDLGIGAELRLANWPQGRKAALSLRFDDSHPTHLSKAIPILREYGFKGTFMVNPGPKEPGSRQNYDFETQFSEWQAVMNRSDMELANHSAHHRGARSDEEMEHEIGSAAEAIWKLTSGKSKLMALNLGGGTRWDTTRTLRYYLDKYHQFDASSGSLGMDDSYGDRVEAFRKAIELHLERGLWCRVHYHYIGDGLSSSEANFRAALDIARQHQDKLWIAGMANIHKYQTERNSAKLTLVRSGASSLEVGVEVGTDPALYDQPLSLELKVPPAWSAGRIKVHDENGLLIPTIAVSDTQDRVLRLEVPPRKATYVIHSDP